jgi:hypothetical protein
MINVPTEPSYFFIREHDLRGGRHTPWIITSYDATTRGHPLSFFTQRNQLYGMGQNAWIHYQDQQLRQNMQQASVRSRRNPRPSTVYELVRIPRRLYDFLPANEVREAIDNIKNSMLHSGNQNLPRKQHGDLVEISILAVPSNDMEAGLFYKTGVAYFHKLEALRQQRNTSPAPKPAPSAPPPPPPPASRPTATPDLAPQPTVTQQVVRGRRNLRHGTVQQQFEFLRRLRAQREKANDAAVPSPTATGTPKP